MEQAPIGDLGMTANIYVRGNVQNGIPAITFDFGNDYEITDTYEELLDGKYRRKTQIDHKGTPENGYVSDTVVSKAYADKMSEIINSLP